MRLMGLPISAPVAASHTRAVLSADAVTTRAPSGLNVALWTISSCCNGLPIGAPVAASHTRAVLSGRGRHAPAVGAEHRVKYLTVVLQGLCRSAPRSPHPTPARPSVLGRGHHPLAVGAERRGPDGSSCCKGLPIGAPVAASHTRAVLSSGRGHHTRPVGAERRARTLRSCRRGLPIGAPVAASHTRAVLSSDAVTTRLPSGLNAALMT